MRHLETWQDIGLVSGSLLALLGLLTLVGRTVRRVWRAAWKLIKRMNLVADYILGDTVRGIPSLMERFTHLDTRLDGLESRLGVVESKLESVQYPVKTPSLPPRPNRHV